LFKGAQNGLNYKIRILRLDTGRPKVKYTNRFTLSQLGRQFTKFV
jgi:hypothetical protein